VTYAQVTYRPRPGATPAAELSALSAVYKFVLETKKAAEPAPELGGQDDVKESNGYVATDKYTR
jgi:hypothetical protein